MVVIWQIARMVLRFCWRLSSYGLTCEGALFRHSVLTSCIISWRARWRIGRIWFERATFGIYM